MFTDKRSKKIILVAHCILNQNSKLDRCAHYPSISLHKSDARGILHSVFLYNYPEYLLLQGICMFTDKRSKKIILVAHCILNQNSKLDRCAHYPGAVTNIAHRLVDSGIGIVQLPCPEMLFLGLDRRADPTAAPAVEQEDTHIGRLMSVPDGQAFCRTLAEDVLRQVQDYRAHGFEVVGLLGVNGSPTCGVETNWSEDAEPAGPGVFIRRLQELLAQNALPLPMRGIKVYQPGPAGHSLEELIGR
jgi:predicted secreted protein